MTNNQKQEFLTLLRKNRLKGKEIDRYKELRNKWIKQRIVEALEDYTPQDLVELLLDTGKHEVEDRNDMIRAIARVGGGHGGSRFILVKCDTMNQVEALEGFVRSRIHTTFNEQEANMF